MTEAIRFRSSFTNSESTDETAAITNITINASLDAAYVFGLRTARKTKFTIINAKFATISVKFKTAAGANGWVISVTKLNVTGTIGTRKMPANMHHITPDHRPFEGIMTNESAMMMVETTRIARNINKYLPVRSRRIPVEAAAIEPKKTKESAIIATSTVEYC